MYVCVCVCVCVCALLVTLKDVTVGLFIYLPLLQVPHIMYGQITVIHE